MEVIGRAIEVTGRTGVRDVLDVGLCVSRRLEVADRAMAVVVDDLAGGKVAVRVRGRDEDPVGTWRTTERVVAARIGAGGGDGVREK